MPNDRSKTYSSHCQPNALADETQQSNSKLESPTHSPTKLSQTHSPHGPPLENRKPNALADETQPNALADETQPNALAARPLLEFVPREIVAR